MGDFALWSRNFRISQENYKETERKFKKSVHYQSSLGLRIITCNVFVIDWHYVNKNCHKNLDIYAVNYLICPIFYQAVAQKTGQTKP